MAFSNTQSINKISGFSNEFKQLFLLQFTKELIKNYTAKEILKLETVLKEKEKLKKQEIKEKLKKISKETYKKEKKLPLLTKEKIRTIPGFKKELFKPSQEPAYIPVPKPIPPVLEKKAKKPLLKKAVEGFKKSVLHTKKKEKKQKVPSGVGEAAGFTKSIMHEKEKPSAPETMPTPKTFEETFKGFQIINPHKPTQESVTHVAQIPAPVVQQKRPTRPIARGPLIIPPVRLPPRLQYLRPYPTQKQINLIKLNPLVNDPLVKVIECNGPNQVIVVKGNMGTKPTNITLDKQEIDQIINIFSQATKIPVQEGIFRVVVGKLILSAIISDVVGSRFIIKKIEPLPTPPIYMPPGSMRRF